MDKFIKVFKNEETEWDEPYCLWIDERAMKSFDGCGNILSSDTIILLDKKDIEQLIEDLQEVPQK